MRAALLDTAFAPWKDKGLYIPVAGGDFESGLDQWTVTGSASVVPDNESFFIAGASHRSSLELKGGATAMTPVLCAGEGYPNARAFARTLAGRGELGVEVLNVNAAGTILSTKSTSKVKTVAPWGPTAPLKISEDEAVRYGGLIRLRFTAPLGSTWRVDDVQLDPRLSR